MPEEGQAAAVLVVAHLQLCRGCRSDHCVVLGGNQYAHELDLRPVEESEHVCVRNGPLLVVRRLCVEAPVDLFARRTVQIPDLEAKASGLDQGVRERDEGDVVGLTVRRLDVVAAVGLHIAKGDEVSEFVGMRLHPSTGKKLDVSDDGHGCDVLVHVVESLEQNVGGSAVHGLHGVGKLAQEVECAFGKLHPDVARVAHVVEQIAHGHEAGFLIAKLVGIAHTQQRLKVGEGDG